MKTARRRVLIALAAILIGFGGALAAAFTAPGGWLVLVAYVVGAAAAWYLYGSAVALATIRAQAAMKARAQANPGAVENLKKWLENQTAAPTEGQEK